MSMKELKKQINENNIGKLYFFTGPEQFLVKHYVNKILDISLPYNFKDLNYNVFEGKVTYRQIEDAVSIFPAFSQRRVVVIKESNLFKSGEKERVWKGFFKSLPDYICLIFIQSETDKRTSLYKALKNDALIVECNWQKAGALTKWVCKVFSTFNKKISDNDAAYFVSLLEPDMTFMILEIEKIVCYMGDKSRVTRDTISDIVSKSVKARIFDLTDAMSQRKMSEAIQIMDELIELREPIPFIMTMVGRQFFTLMKTKKLEEKRIPHNQMARLLGIRPYFMDKTRKQASYFTMDMLKHLSRKCSENDLAVKTGRIDGRLALELLLMEI